MEIVQLNSNAKLSEHFTLGEFTKSGSHPEVYNIPSHEAIANMKRLCVWLEELRKRYNDKYVAPQPLSSRPSTPSPLSSRPSVARGEISQMRPGAQAASRKDSSTSLGMTGGGSALGMTGGGAGRDDRRRGAGRDDKEEVVVINESVFALWCSVFY